MAKANSCCRSCKSWARFLLRLEGTADRRLRESRRFFSPTLNLANLVEEFFQQLTNGLAVGGIYALIALGYTMVYGVLKLINFAHGDLFTYGAYLGLTLLTSLALTDRLGFALGVLVLVLMVMGLVAVLGAILERAAYRPLRESPRLSAVVSALGASIFLQNALMLIYGARFRFIPKTSCPPPR
jgi:branched-chain amino acid transport system permease protein